MYHRLLVLIGLSVLLLGADEPPEEVALTLEVSADMLAIDGEEILPLEDGYVGQASFTSRYSFSIKGLVEPVEEALTVERRRRAVYGEELSVGRVLVKAGPKVPADTLLGLQRTLAKTDLEWMTLEVGEQDPVHLRLTGDFLGGRRTSFSTRKPKPANAKPKEVKAVLSSKKLGSGRLENIFGSSSSKSGGGVVGGVGSKGFGRISGLGKVGTAKSSGGGGLVVGRGSGGLGLRGTGGGGGGGSYGTIGTGRLGWPSCSTRAKKAPGPIALTHATIKLYPKRFDAWLSRRHTSYPKYMSEKFEVDEGGVEGVADYPWWKLYNALAKMQTYYGEAQTLLIWPHPSLGGEFLAQASRLNCELPRREYESKEAWQKARSEMQECTPMFRQMELANGRYPRKGEEE